MAGQERQLKAIVFSDVVDSSVQIFADELIAIQRIKEDLTLIREELQRQGGSLVKSLGDGLLATFDGPTQALDFVQAAVQALAARSGRGRQSLEHRFGLHTGEIYADGDDIIGQGVHLASRLQTVSPPNGVAFVRSTYELIDPRFRRLAVSMGDVQLKGLPEPMPAYCLGPDVLLDFGHDPSAGSLQLETLLQDTPYQPVRSLGRSSAQQTVLLQERLRERQAVLKLIPAAADLVDALTVEAACLDRLRHPRIPRVLDGFARGGQFCFIQEYIPGPSLQGSMDLLRRKQRLAEMLRQVLEVLEVVHAAGLVHGDVHPANLIPAANGGPLFLVDFSLLKARTEAGAAQQGSGRPFFSAPERARFGRLTPSADLYALGVTALVLYTGQPPASLYDPDQARWSLEGLDPEVAAWLAPLLEDLPARRLQQAADALRMLDQPLPPQAAASPPLPPAPVVGTSLAVTAGVSKAALHDLLVVTYGPMVEMLLDSQPSSIAAAQLPALLERLVAAGLAEADVREALAHAQLPASVADSEEPLASTLPDPSPVAVVSAVALDASQALPLLRDLIGPIADLIWTAELEAAAAQDPGRLRALLLQSSVPPASADALLAQLQQSPVAVPPAVTLAATVEPATAASASVDSASAVDAEQLLLRSVGPIGSAVWQQVVDLPVQQRVSVLLELLQGYGLDQARLDDLRRQLEGG
jgi:class 3 adenylate cyclase/serine/threonine protein kinase